VVIEMNPRVSRSSALASKANGFRSPRSPRCWRLATPLDEIPKRHHQSHAASFEPSLDYVCSDPRWAFEKFPGVDQRLARR